MFATFGFVETSVINFEALIRVFGEWISPLKGRDTHIELASAAGKGQSYRALMPSGASLSVFRARSDAASRSLLTKKFGCHF